jgi:hypothetical protein
MLIFWAILVCKRLFKIVKLFFFCALRVVFSLWSLTYLGNTKDTKNYSKSRKKQLYKI